MAKRWHSYYWLFLKELGRECYGTWRQELAASLVTVLFYYAINRNDFDLRRGVQATVYTLVAFVIWHATRTPWLLYKRERTEHLAWGWGIAGSVFALGTLSLTAYGALWFYTMQPKVDLTKIPDGRDKRVVELEVQVKALAPFQEPENSLRRQTIRLANELYLFWSARPVPPQPVSNPSTEEEKKRNAAWDKYWREATVAYDRRDYKDRIVGIIRQYKLKGIPTGFLEPAAENHQFGASAFSVSGSPVCFQDEVCQFRELAYHIDARDQMIGPDF